MRLWHYKLIPVLPKAMLVSQWRECIAIKRQWEKGTLKHRLVSYVKNYEKVYFMNYVIDIITEMDNRQIKYQSKYFYEICDFCQMYGGSGLIQYKEHNDRYFTQCYYNLEEKHDRGIISDEEWKKVNATWWDYQDRGYY